MSIANPARPRSYNATMTASGWGTIYVKIDSIEHGMSIGATASTNRFSRTLMVDRRTSGSFSLTLLCSSEREYQALGDWIKGYGRKVADPSGGVGPVRVVCPSRNFDKVAVPRGVDFGTDTRTIVERPSLDFIGARDPVPLTADYVSSFSLPAGSQDLSLPYYYPGGTQLSGAGMGADTLYDIKKAAQPKPETSSGGTINPGTPGYGDVLGPPSAPLDYE